MSSILALAANDRAFSLRFFNIIYKRAHNKWIYNISNDKSIGCLWNVTNLTLLSIIGGRTTDLSNILMTSFHNSRRIRFNTGFSQVWANNDNEPSIRSINGRNISSTSIMDTCCGFWLPPLMLCNSSPSSLTLFLIWGSKLKQNTDYVRQKRNGTKFIWFEISKHCRTGIIALDVYYLFPNFPESSSNAFKSCVCKSFRMSVASSSNCFPPMDSNIFVNCTRSCWILFINMQAYIYIYM